MINLTVNSKSNCFELPGNTWEKLESIAASTTLESGVYILRIKTGTYSFWNSGDKKEPCVMIWVHGGKFTNLATKVKTRATLMSLNGYDDLVSIKIKQTTNLYAFFLDSYSADNRGKVILSIQKDLSYQE